MRIMVVLIVFALALLAAAEARAQTSVCTCRYAGQSYRLGTCCLHRHVLRLPVGLLQ